MSQFNIASFSDGDQEKVAVDPAASGVAFKERHNMPVVPEVVAREMPEHLREYFWSVYAITGWSVSSCRKRAILAIQKWQKRTVKNRVPFSCYGWLKSIPVFGLNEWLLFPDLNPGVRAAVMLRTEPAGCLCPVPIKSGQRVSILTQPLRLQQPFRLRRSVAPLPALLASRR